MHVPPSPPLFLSPSLFFLDLRTSVQGEKPNKDAAAFCNPATPAPAGASPEQSLAEPFSVETWASWWGGGKLLLPDTQGQT